MDRLTVKECRKLAPDATANLSDAQVEALADQLHKFAAIVIDAYSDIEESVEEIQSQDMEEIFSPEGSGAREHGRRVLLKILGSE